MAEDTKHEEPLSTSARNVTGSQISEAFQKPVRPITVKGLTSRPTTYSPIDEAARNIDANKILSGQNGGK